MSDLLIYSGFLLLIGFLSNIIFSSLKESKLKNVDFELFMSRLVGNISGAGIIIFLTLYFIK